MAREYPRPEDRPNRGGRGGRHRPDALKSEDTQSPERNGPEPPDSWRSWMSVDYDYPDEIDDLSGRDRRRAKKSWRRDDHAQRMAWLRNQRQAEPTSPIIVVALVLIVAIVILGLGGGLPRLLGKDNPEGGKPVGLLTPAGSVPLPTAGPTSEQTLQPTAPAVLTTPPPETGGPDSEAIASASSIVGDWARAFYARDPNTESYAALVTRCAKFMTAEVAQTFASAGDSTYEALKADGGRSTVSGARVSAPRPEEAPTDTPTRISRLVVVAIDITGKRPQKITLPLLVTVAKVDARWLISAVTGGTGP
jgi:hypothetical protein